MHKHSWDWVVLCIAGTYALQHRGAPAMINMMQDLGLVMQQHTHSAHVAT